jgi:hypothetical protein
MVRTRLGIALAVAAVASAGACSDSRTGAEGPPAPDPTPVTSAPTVPADGPADIVVLGDDRGGRGRMCLIRPNLYFYWEDLTVSRPARLTSLELEGATGGTRVERAWTLIRPEGEIPRTGMARGSTPPRRVRSRIGWSTRRAMERRLLQPDVEYYAAALLRLRPRTAFRQVLATAYDQEGRTDTDGDNLSVRIRGHCR